MKKKSYKKHTQTCIMGKRKNNNNYYYTTKTTKLLQTTTTTNYESQSTYHNKEKKIKKTALRAVNRSKRDSLLPSNRAQRSV